MFNGDDCRKIGADYYIDDKALSIKDFVNLKINSYENSAKIYDEYSLDEQDWSGK